MLSTSPSSSGIVSAFVMIVVGCRDSLWCSRVFHPNDSWCPWPHSFSSSSSGTNSSLPWVPPPHLIFHLLLLYLSLSFDFFRGLLCSIKSLTNSAYFSGDKRDCRSFHRSLLPQPIFCLGHLALLPEHLLPFLSSVWPEVGLAILLFFRLPVALLSLGLQLSFTLLLRTPRTWLIFFQLHPGHFLSHYRYILLFTLVVFRILPILPTPRCWLVGLLEVTGRSGTDFSCVGLGLILNLHFPNLHFPWKKTCLGTSESKRNIRYREECYRIMKSI